MRLATCAATLSLLVSAAPAFAQAPPAAPPPEAVPAAEPPPPPAPPPPPVVEAAPVVAAPAAPVVPPAPPAPPAWNAVMKEELLVDTYYMMNFNGLTSGQNTLLPPAGRIFDNQSNSFTMNYAKVGLEIDADPVTVRADLGYGYLGGALLGTPGQQAFVVQQAYAALKIPGTPLTLDMGRFVTGAGAEVIEANKNWLYSRSFLFGIIPFYHTGARLTLKANDQFSAQLTLANSQGTPDPDVNSGKVVGLQLTITPIAPLSILATGYVGREGPQGNQGPEKLTLDLVAAYTVSDAVGLNLNFDYIKYDQANAVGVAGMAHFVAAEHLTFSARAEFLKDKGILFVPGMNDPLVSRNLFEATINGGVPFAGHFEARLELRGDFAGEAIYPGGDAGKKNQFTGTVAFLGFI
jgi:Putative beta-barrel porin-2, OmpL-like. bbp2